MTTLFARLIHFDLPVYDPGPDPENPNPPAAEEQSIDMHAFSACINFQGSGFITGPEIVGWFNLVGEQVSDLQYTSQLAGDAGGIGKREAFMRVYKDFLYNGVGKTADDPWRIELEFWTVLMNVISNAGGNPTPMPQYLKDRLGV